MSNIYISTTGVTPSVILRDLGERTLTHPLSYYNIGSEYRYTELLGSTDFGNSLDSGYLTASIGGIIISSSNGFSPATIKGLDTINISLITVTSSIVTGTATFSSANFNSINTSSITSTSSTVTGNATFNNVSTTGAATFSSANFNRVVTSSLTSTSSTFTGPATFSGGAFFNSINTSLITTTSSIVTGAATFSSANFSIINTSTITSTSSTFNGFSTFSSTASFVNTGVYYKNPANTFNYILNTSAITANRNLTIPLLTADDTFVLQGFSQTLTNKTLTSPLISGGTVSGATVSSSTLLSATNIIEATRLQTFTVSSISPSTGNSLVWTGATWSPITGATAQSTPTDPATTTSTTGVMMGLSGSITPVTTGTVLIIICGDLDNTANGGGSQVQIRTGTGSAPTNGSALTGTTRGSLIKGVNGGNQPERFPLSISALVAGLAINTTIWVDLSLAAITSGTSRLRDISISIIEI